MGVTSIRINENMESKLETVAKELHRSKGWAINEALRESLRRKEIEERRWHETLEAIKEANKGEVVSSVEAFDWLDTWGTTDENVETAD